MTARARRVRSALDDPGVLEHAAHPHIGKPKEVCVDGPLFTAAGVGQKRARVELASRAVGLNDAGPKLEELFLAVEPDLHLGEPEAAFVANGDDLVPGPSTDWVAR